MIIFAVSWLVHAVAFRGQHNVIVAGSKGTITRGGVTPTAVLAVLPSAEARSRAAEIAHSIEQGVYDPWPAPTN